jgi:hypothetical protein
MIDNHSSQLRKRTGITRGLPIGLTIKDLYLYSPTPRDLISHRLSVNQIAIFLLEQKYPRGHEYQTTAEESRTVANRVYYVALR